MSSKAAELWLVANNKVYDKADIYYSLSGAFPYVQVSWSRNSGPEPRTHSHRIDLPNWLEFLGEQLFISQFKDTIKKKKS
jgi:hypothetical protein